MTNIDFIDNIKIDPATGLPVVPEGYFWVITHGFSSEYLRIEFRKKRRWFGSKVVEWTVIKKNEATSARILDRAILLLRYDVKSLMSPGTGWQKFIGVYPPSKLP